MKKPFIIFAVLVCSLGSVHAQNTDLLPNKASAIKATKKPLYVVDGIKQNTLVEFNMTSLKTGNIEEVKVLKSEEAVKLYGTEAINGAVLITTKLGKNNVNNIELESKLASLNLDKSISILRDITFIAKNTSRTDSIKPHTPSRIIFGGLNSIVDNPNDPVYVVDGDKVEKSSINFLSPESIESVTILKKNDTTELYGAQAVNGVILITTKKAKKSLSTEFEKHQDKN